MTSHAMRLTPMHCSLYDQETPYECSLAQSAPPPIAGADGDGPQFGTESADVDSVTEDYGIVSLRMPTSRGNILVIGNVLDIEAARRDLKQQSGEDVDGRRKRIMALIEEDTELSERSKEIAEFLLVKWPNQFTGFLILLVWVVVCLPSGVITLASIFSPGRGGQQASADAFEVAIVFTGFGLLFLFCDIVICVTDFPKKCRMERELMNARAETQ
jgi:hypothetical protein